MRLTAGDDAPIEPGTYAGIITGIETRQKDDRSFLLWSFEVATRSGSAVVRRPTSTSFGTRATARLFAEAALGRQLRPWEAIDTDDLIGRPVRLTIGRRFLANGTEVASVEHVTPAEPFDVPF